MSEPLFNMPRSRFSPTVESIQSSLEWHSRVTKELQRRVLEAQEYVRRHSGDRQLLRILEGAPPEPPDRRKDAQGQTSVGEGFD